MLLARGLRTTDIHLPATATSTKPTAGVAATTTTTEAAGTPSRTLRSLVDADLASVEFDIVHLRDRILSRRLLCEAHKAETATTSGVKVLHNNLVPVRSA